MVRTKGFGRHIGDMRHLPMCSMLNIQSGIDSLSFFQSKVSALLYVKKKNAT
jgi:hypothetical protein